MLDIILDFLGDLLIFFLPVKRKMDVSKAWSGTVEKKIVRSSPTLSPYRYSVIFRTDQGKKKKMRMKKADFDRYQEGLRYIKKSGEGLPVPHLN
jgi:hypothetical protein